MQYLQPIGVEMSFEIGSSVFSMVNIHGVDERIYLVAREQLHVVLEVNGFTG